MKGVVLAGGTGSRLLPLTKVTNKHLLPVGRYPMIYHPVAKLAEAGIHEIMIVTGVDHIGDIVGVLGSGRSLGLSFTYRVQDRAGGIAEALGLAQDFVREDKCVVILGDNIFEDSLTSYVENYVRQAQGARILLKEVTDPERFGVAEVRGGRLVSIEEKPMTPKSNLAVTGVYMYDAAAFAVIASLEPSKRGELEITDVNNQYIEDGRMEFDILRGWWTDAGTFESLARATKLTEGIAIRTFSDAMIAREQG